MRNIFIPEAVADALESNRQKQEKMKSDLGPEYQDYNMVIAQPNGRPFEEHQICQKFKSLITVDGKIKYTNFGHEKYTTLRHKNWAALATKGTTFATKYTA